VYLVIWWHFFALSCSGPIGRNKDQQYLEDLTTNRYTHLEAEKRIQNLT